MQKRVGFNWGQKRVEVRTPPNHISVQELVNAIAAEQATINALAHPVIASYEGKKSLPSGEVTPITLTIEDGWRIAAVGPDAVEVFSVEDGLVRSSGEEGPFDHPPRGFIRNVTSLSEKFGVLGSSRQLEHDFDAWGRLHGDLAIALAYFDIDKFKDLNTEHTEAAVDEYILQPYQAALRKHHELSYSVGGDEFVALFLNVTLESARNLAERLRSFTEVLRFRISGKDVRMTVSLGLAAAREGESISELQVRAGRAKQRAKDNGRNHVAEDRG